MLYVSNVIKDNQIEVTDTSTGKTEILSNKAIVKLVENKEADIYGVDVYNHKAECTPLKINQTLDILKLIALINKWRKIHNSWTAKPVEDYLACLKVGTIINVDYHDKDTAGRVFSGTTTLKKLNYDEWLFTDEENTCSGNKGDSRFAAWALDVSCISCHLDKMYTNRS